MISAWNFTVPDTNSSLYRELATGNFSCMLWHTANLPLEASLAYFGIKCGPALLDTLTTKRSEPFDQCHLNLMTLTSRFTPFLPIHIPYNNGELFTAHIPYVLRSPPIYPLDTLYASAASSANASSYFSRIIF